MNDRLDLCRPWRDLFPSPLVLALILFASLTGLRAYGYLSSDLHQAQPVMIGFVLMCFVPLVFLTAYGREQIGFGKRLSWKWIFVGILLGAAAAALCYLLGALLYGRSDQNWIVSIAYTFQSDERISQIPHHMAFVAFTVPAILASPVGEETFFRGVIEQSNRERMTPRAAACLAAGLFALAHLVHHGIYRGMDGVEIMPTSGLIWFFLMFATSLVFSFLRQKSGSIWTAIAAHAAFNLVINITIFYSLFVESPQTFATG